jgi:hypothetical protein
VWALKSLCCFCVCVKKYLRKTRRWWLTPVILAMQEAEIRRSHSFTIERELSVGQRSDFRYDSKSVSFFTYFLYKIKKQTEKAFFSKKRFLEVVDYRIVRCENNTFFPPIFSQI